MKVYFHISSLGNGGAERVMANLASEFSKRGHEVAIITCVNVSVEYEVNENVKRYLLFKSEDSKTILRHIQRIVRLREMLQEDQPDVIVSFMENSNIRATFAALFLPVKSVFSVRNTPEEEYGNHLGLKTFSKILFRFADGGVFQTQDAKEWFPKSVQDKSTIIFNPVNELFYKTAWHPIHGNVITCGRLEKQKNHKMLVSSFSHVVKAYATCKLYIYGAGGLRDELQQQIQDLGLSDNVFLLGRISHVEDALSEAEIFVLSSDYEGMPNALMEAMTVGVPCISTDCPCGGPRALLEGGKSGVLVPVGDEQAMAQAIINLLNDEELRTAYSKKAKTAAENFTQGKIYQQWLAYIESLMRE